MKADVCMFYTNYNKRKFLLNAPHLTLDNFY